MTSKVNQSTKQRNARTEILIFMIQIIKGSRPTRHASIKSYNFWKNEPKHRIRAQAHNNEKDL